MGEGRTILHEERVHSHDMEIQVEADQRVQCLAEVNCKSSRVYAKCDSGL